MTDSKFTLGQLATMACALEVTIPKPGNVHRSADFADTTIYDFLLSGIAIAPAIERAQDDRLGQTILQACKATQQVVQSNTNLGIILLLAPLAKVTKLNLETLFRCIENSDANDCRDVYDAIRLCNPGGLGQSNEFDVSDDEPPESLLQAMTLASDRDMIARQYANGFRDLLETIVPILETGLKSGLGVTDAVIDAHVKTMAEFPDTLISRKTDRKTAETAAALASAVGNAGVPGSSGYIERLADLDFWLRSDGNRRNPGTTADLVTAAIFVCLRTGTLTLPASFVAENS